MKILGIDPGLKETGFGIIDENRNLISRGIIKGKNFLEQIKKFEKVINKDKIDFVFLEDVFSYKNPRMSLKLGEIRGALIYFFESKGIKVINLQSSKIKRILTGNGRAKKEQIKFMVKSFLRIKENISEHESDALACAIAGLFLQKNVF